MGLVNKKPKLAFFTSNLMGGGAERVIVSMANHIQSFGYDVDLVLVQATGVYMDEVEKGVRIVSLDASKNIYSLFPFIRYLRKERPKTVVSTLLMVNIIAVLSRKLSGVNTRLILREAINASADVKQTNDKVQRYFGWLRKWALKNADALIAPSSGVAKDLQSKYKLDSSKTHVIYNPVEIEQMIALGKRKESLLEKIGSGVPIILGVGRLNFQKNFDALIEAYEKVLRVKKAELIILGEGPERESLENIVSEKGLNGRVHMPGFLSNPFPIFRKASVFVLSSRYEGMPNALTQSLVFQLQVVSTDCPSGPSELLEGGKYGYLTDVGNTDALAEGILKGLSEELETVPAKLVKGKFDASLIAKKYLKVMLGEGEKVDQLIMPDGINK